MADDLVDAARILTRAAERLTSNNSLSSSNSSEVTPVVATPVTTGSSPRSPENELRSLFPHHFQPFQRQSTMLNPRQNSRKRKNKRAETAKNAKCKLITRKFVCLCDKDQVETPDAEEQRELLMSGLGEVKIAVPEESNEIGVRELIVKTFPKLKDAGGFELMYAEPRKRELKVIPPGPIGLTMTYLVTFIGQGKIYVRPIQQDLVLDSPKDLKPPNMVQKETCKNCLSVLDVYAMREHYASCLKQKSGKC